jgi:hypothetical protein
MGTAIIRVVEKCFSLISEGDEEFTRIVDARERWVRQSRD